MEPFSNSCEIPKIVIIKPLQILLVQQNLNALLDIPDLWNESLPDLVDGLADEHLVLHPLAGLHDPDNRRLKHRVSTEPRRPCKQTAAYLKEKLAIFLDRLVRLRFLLLSL